MSVNRVLFLSLLILPVLAFAGTLYVLRSAFGGSSLEASTPHRNSARRVSRGARPTSPPTAVSVKAVHTSAPTAVPEPTRTPVPAATPAPAPSPTAGIIALSRFWIGSTVARHGRTISFGYVIDNETGQTADLMLGASIKPARTRSWLTAAISDPSHDVVAAVPPGVTTHVRYFTIPARLRPGRYDVAWGLRNVANGSAVALVSSAASLGIRG